MISKRDVKLLLEQDLTYVRSGPADGAWRSPFLLCPQCRELMSKDATGTCRCGGITVDAGALRIALQGISESEVLCFDLRDVRRTPTTTFNPREEDDHQ